MDKEDEEVLAPWGYLDDEAADRVVEVHDGRLVVHVVCVLFVGVLVGVIVVECAFVVPSRHDVQMIMDRPPTLIHPFTL